MYMRTWSRLRTASGLIAAIGIALCSGQAAQALTQNVSGDLDVGDDDGNFGQAVVTGFADLAIAQLTPTDYELTFNASRFDAGTVPIVFHELPGGLPDDTSWIDIAFSLTGTAPGVTTFVPAFGVLFDLTGMTLRLDEGFMDDTNGLARDFATDPLDFVLPATSVFVAAADLVTEPRFVLPLDAQADVAGWGAMVISGAVLVPEPGVRALACLGALAAAALLRTPSPAHRS